MFAISAVALFYIELVGYSSVCISLFLTIVRKIRGGLSKGFEIFRDICSFIGSSIFTFLGLNAFIGKCRDKWWGDKTESIPETNSLNNTSNNVSNNTSNDNTEFKRLDLNSYFKDECVCRCFKEVSKYDFRDNLRELEDAGYILDDSKILDWTRRSRDTEDQPMFIERLPLNCPDNKYEVWKVPYYEVDHENQIIHLHRSQWCQEMREWLKERIDAYKGTLKSEFIQDANGDFTKKVWKDGDTIIGEAPLS